MYNFEECWYKNVCPLYEDNCTSDCIRYKEMYFLLHSSNIPKDRFMPDILTPNKCDYDEFVKLSRCKDNIKDFVAQNKNLYIASSITGNGKTSWAIKLMLKYFNDVWAGNGFKVRGLFIHIPTFILKCKDFGNKDAEFENMKRLLPDVDLVIWDDISSINISSYDHSQLLMYIDARYQKSNIYTSNITTADSLEKLLGAKLTSRIFSKDTEIVIFNGGDRR